MPSSKPTLYDLSSIIFLFSLQTGKSRKISENQAKKEEQKKGYPILDCVFIWYFTSKIRKKKSKRLAGIYELPGDQENFSFLKEVLITQKKRTIGNTEYDESIFQAKIEKDIVKKGNSLQWVKWKDLDNITLSGPHRKWIEEIRTISK